MNFIFKSRSTKHSFAFTLAEVLITVGIIGIVAAMTLPTLIQNYQKKEAATKLEYTYSVLYQAILLSEKDNGPESEWEVEKDGYTVLSATENLVKKYIQPYLKVIKEDKFKSSSAPYDYYYRKDGKLVKIHGHSLYSIVLENGIYLNFNASSFTDYAITLRIDINGKHGPNIVGKDTFVIDIYPKIKTRASDINNRDTLLALCKSNDLNAQSVACPALIQHDGWKISKDYPW